jgi:hypothetical protein
MQGVKSIRTDSARSKIFRDMSNGVTPVVSLGVSLDSHFPMIHFHPLKTLKTSGKPDLLWIFFNNRRNKEKKSFFLSFLSLSNSFQIIF